MKYVQSKSILSGFSFLKIGLRFFNIDNDLPKYSRIVGKNRIEK